MHRRQHPQRREAAAAAAGRQDETHQSPAPSKASGCPLPLLRSPYLVRRASSFGMRLSGGKKASRYDRSSWTSTTHHSSPVLSCIIQMRCCMMIYGAWVVVCFCLSVCSFLFQDSFRCFFFLLKSSSCSCCGYFFFSFCSCYCAFITVFFLFSFFFSVFSGVHLFSHHILLLPSSFSFHLLWSRCHFNIFFPTPFPTSTFSSFYFLLYCASLLFICLLLLLFFVAPLFCSHL